MSMEYLNQINEALNYIQSKTKVKPEIGIIGSKGADIHDEELGVFDHDEEKRWFGSPEKAEKYGIQDDTVYGAGWAVYGGRMKGADDFRIRSGANSFGIFYPAMGNLGRY